MTRATIAFVLLLAACGGKPPVESPKENAIVQVRANVKDAQLYVDGRFIGPLDAIGGGVSVAAGTHRLEIRHEDYFSSYLELTLVKAERKKVAIELQPVLP
jgi:hypothetical protein